MSVRLSVSNVEVLAANAAAPVAAGRRAEVVPRVCDLEALAASTSGKIEIETLEEGREGQIVDNMLKGAVLTVFKERLSPEQLRDVVTAFDEGVVAHTGEDVPSAQLAELVDQRPGACASRSRASPGATSRRRRWPAPSSSCSRACTSRSGSTRTPAAPGRPTAAGADRS